MVVDNQERLTSLEMYRPVTGGARAFLDKVQLSADEILGTDTLDLIEKTGDSSHTTKLVGIPRSRVDVEAKGPLRLMLFERHATEPMHMQGTFRNAVTRLEANADPFYAYVSPRQDSHQGPDRSLEVTLRRAALRYDIPDQRSVSVSLDGIVLNNTVALDNQRIELALTPAPESEVTAMLVEQTNLCLRALAAHGRKSVYPLTPYTVSAPFAEIPDGIAMERRKEFIEAIKEFLPIQVSVGALNINLPRQY